MSPVKTTARDAILRLTNPRLLWKMSRRQDRPIKRILVVRPDHLGDLLFATPALRLLRRAFPDAHITGLAAPWGKAMWQGNPDLDALETLRFPGMGAKEGGPLAPYLLLRQEGSRLEHERYDLGIVLRFDHWWGAALMAAARIPHRWGYDTPGMGEWLTNSVEYTAGKHEVEQDLTLMQAVVKSMGTAPASAPTLPVDRAMGLPNLITPPEEQPSSDFYARWLDARYRVIIHPGTTAANKLWTIEGWSKVAQALVEKGWSVALTGTAQEKPIADAILRHIKPEATGMHNFAGLTANLPQLIWLLMRADMVLGVDNGPLHIASALKVPNVRLYGPSDEKVWGPWGDAKINRVVRAAGTQPSQHLDTGSPEIEGGTEMRAISADQVLREVDSLNISKS